MAQSVALITEEYDQARLFLDEHRRRAGPNPRESLLGAVLEAGSGRWSRAAIEMDGAGEPVQTIGLVCALTPFLPLTRSQVEAARRQAEQDVDAGSDPAVREARRAYVLGLLDLRLGREEPALSAASAIDSLADHVPARDTATVRLLARSIRATAAASRGDAPAALAELGHVDGPMRVEHTLDPVLDRLRERYLLGVLLLENGRPREALRWLEHGMDGWAVLIYRPIAHLRLAEAHQRLGNLEDARRHYAHFLRLWDRADPELQPLVDQARAALARLAAEAE